MGRIFRKCETRLQWILTCIKRQKITGTMKTVYLVCLVAAGAAFAFAADHCNRNDGGCVPVITDPDPVNPPKSINCPVCKVRAIAEKCTNPDKFVPTCNGDKFAKYQYDEAKDEHFCVYIDGTEITEPATRKPGKGEGEACASFPDMPEAAPTEGPSKTPCLDKKTEAGEKGDFVLCAEAGKYAGFFEATQTKDKYRWCVNPSGQPIPGTFTEKEASDKADCGFYRDFRHTCTGDGFFPASWDCTRYITCSGGFAHHCKCDSGLAWDTTRNICNDWEKVSRCTVEVP